MGSVLSAEQDELPATAVEFIREIIEAYGTERSEELVPLYDYVDIDEDDPDDSDDSDSECDDEAQEKEGTGDNDQDNNDCDSGGDNDNDNDNDDDSDSENEFVVVEVEGTELGMDVVMALSKVLLQSKSSAKISGLRLVNCGLSVKGGVLSALLSGLPGANNLRILDFSENELGSAGAALLVHALADVSPLQQLFLTEAGLGDEGALKVVSLMCRHRRAKPNEEKEEIEQRGGGQNVKYIELSGNDITAAGMSMLMRKVAALRLFGKIDVSDASESLQADLKKTLKSTSCTAASTTATPSAASSSSLSSPMLRVQQQQSGGRRRGGTISALHSSGPPKANSTAGDPLPDWPRTESARFKVGCAETIGRRSDMQDTTVVRGRFRDRDDEDLFCVFDGHGTKESARYVAKHLSDVLAAKLDELADAHDDDGAHAAAALEDDAVAQALVATFEELHLQIKEWAFKNGTTAAVALFRGDRLWVANLGDSRAVLSRNAKALRLSIDHKASDGAERQRIEAMGGTVVNGRVSGMLQVSRALGDQICAPYVSHVPHIERVTIDRDSDRFLIVACDGLFDIFVDQLAVAIASRQDDPERAANMLMNQAFLSGSTDNISIIVIHLWN
jgi:serine/threonine protein phosphatase PrpC